MDTGKAREILNKSLCTHYGTVRVQKQWGIPHLCHEALRCGAAKVSKNNPIDGSAASPQATSG